MNLGDIEKSIEVILERELEYEDPKKLGKFTFTIYKKDGKLIEYQLFHNLDSLPLLVRDPDKEIIKSDNFEMLMSLYQKAISERTRKKTFVTRFIKVLSKMQVRMNRVLYFCLYFLFKTEELEAFPKMRKTNLFVPLIAPLLRIKILAMISQIIRYEYKFVTEKQISVFRSIIKGILPKRETQKVLPGTLDVALGRLMTAAAPTAEAGDPLLKMSKLIDRQIREVEFRNIGLKLADINPVINEDRKRSLKILRELKFDPKFSEALNIIEEYFGRGQFSQQEAATCIAKIGSFILDFNMELIGRIEEKSGQRFTGNKRDVASTIQYLNKQQVGFFNQKEAQLYKSVYDLCSDTGRHHLLSKKEHARISKNVMIELILLALQKLQKYSSKQNERPSKNKNA